MKRVSFSDWQEMALKKDVEDIKKKLNSHETVFFSLCWEIVIALGSIIVDHLFDTEQAPISIWIILIIIAVIPAVFALAHIIIPLIHSYYLAKKGNLTIRSYIDIFDNQISYWVMLSNSYADMLTQAKNDKKSTNAEKEFLYREGCYYNNKSMHTLYSMKPNFDKIFCSDIDTVKKRNLIDIARLHNLLMVMNEQQAQLDRDINGVESQGVAIQKSMNEKYLDELQGFLEDLNCVFSSIEYNWELNQSFSNPHS